MSKLTPNDRVHHAAARPPSSPVLSRRKSAAGGTRQSRNGMRKEHSGRASAPVAQRARKATARGFDELHPAQIVSTALSSHRHPDRFTDQAFRALKADIQRCGRNLIPICVRPTGATVRIGDRELPQYELGFGARRHRACSELDLPVAAVIGHHDEAQILALMHAENSYRKDLSAYERGVLYDGLIEQEGRNAVGSRPYRNQTELAKGLGVDAGDVSRCRFLALLPAAVLDVFESPLGLAIHDVNTLRPVFEAHQDEVLRRAAEIVEREGKLPVKGAIRRLTNFSARPPRTPVLKRPILVRSQQVGVTSIYPGRRVSIDLDKPMAPEDVKSLEAGLRRVLTRILTKSNR